MAAQVYNPATNSFQDFVPLPPAVKVGAANDPATFGGATLNAAQQLETGQGGSGGGSSSSAPAGGTSGNSNTSPQNQQTTSTVAGATGATTATTVNGANNGGYNTQNVYTAQDANGTFTYQVDQNGNIINKQYSRPALNNSDPNYSAAEAALAPSASESEDDFFAKISSQLQPLFDQINGAEAAAETAANVTATQETSAANFASNAQGMAGSSEADATATQIDQSKAAAIAQAKQTQTAALSTAYQFLTSSAWSAFQDARNNNQTLAQNYVTQMQAQASSVITSLFASGASPASLMQSNPLEYQTLLQYYNGDPNAMNAAYVAAAQKSLVNNGQPVFSSGNQVVYGQMGTNPDGSPSIKYTTITLPQNLPQNYKISSFNQAVNGQIAYIATPVDANGNAILDPTKPNNGIVTGFFGSTVDNNSQGTTPDPTSSAITSATGLSIEAFNFLTQGTSALSRLTSSQRQQYMQEAQDWANKNGIDLSTFQSEYTALNTTLSNNIQRFNNTKIAEGEVTGTLANIDTASISAGLNTVNMENVGKILAGQQVNDASANAYAFYFNDLKNSLAYFYAAQQGKASPDVIDDQQAAQVIVGGLADGGVSGLQSAVEATATKMQTVLSTAVDSAQQQIWTMFGVGGDYNPSSSTNIANANGSSGGGSSALPVAGSIYQDPSTGLYWQVGADGETMTQVPAPTQ